MINNKFESKNHLKNLLFQKNNKEKQDLIKRTKNNVLNKSSPIIQSPSITQVLTAINRIKFLKNKIQKSNRRIIQNYPIFNQIHFKNNHHHLFKQNPNSIVNHKKKLTFNNSKQNLSYINDKTLTQFNNNNNNTFRKKHQDFLYEPQLQNREPKKLFKKIPILSNNSNIRKINIDSQKENQSTLITLNRSSREKINISISRMLSQKRMNHSCIVRQKLINQQKIKSFNEKRKMDMLLKRFKVTQSRQIGRKSLQNFYQQKKYFIKKQKQIQRNTLRQKKWKQISKMNKIYEQQLRKVNQYQQSLLVEDQMKSYLQNQFFIQ